MSSVFQQLKNEAVRSDAKISDLLRKAKIHISRDVSQKDFLSWINNELNGYHNGEKVPGYRVVQGEPRGWNPYNTSWIPFIHDHSEIQETISKRGVNSSVSELEDLLQKDSGNQQIQMPYPADAQKLMSEGVGLQTQFSLFLSPTVVVGILESVRNKLIDHLVELDDCLAGNVNIETEERVHNKNDIVWYELWWAKYVILPALGLVLAGLALHIFGIN